MGWIIAIILSASVLAALYFSRRCSRMALELAAVAVLIGLVGYAWQGSPDMAGHPVTASPQREGSAS